MNITFTGQVALVAGGTGGLGRAVSLAFLAEGSRVIVTYRNAEEYSALQAAAGANAGNLEGHVVDVTDESAVTGFVSTVLTQYGKIDAVVNTVGGYAGGMKLWETDAKTLDRMFQLNFRSGFTLTRAVLPALLKQRHGSFVNVAAKAAFDHASGAAAYAASKAAAVALMDSLAADARNTGVRVNSVLPAIIDTPPNRKAMPDADFDTWPKPEEIAHVILFLCSDLARVIHGASVTVYGNNG